MFKSVPFDIIIPVHKKDLAVLEYCIEAARKKIVGAGRIITISKERYTNNAEWFSESQFPFDIEFVRNYGFCGWHFQQLLKLYAPLVIPNISENVLILDSDTVFFRRTKMFDAQNRPFYNISKDKQIRYKPFNIKVEEHIKKLWPTISYENLPEEFQEISGICHSMMFNRTIISQLFAKVEEYDGTGDKFYKIFLKHAGQGQGVSEYQIYFNFLLIFYSDKIAIRKLKYKNTADLNIKKYRKRLKYSYCSFHSYLRCDGDNYLRIKCKNFFKKIYSELFQIEQWNIGIAACNIAQFLTIPNQKIKWLKSSKLTEFRADPFGLVQNGKQFIFFEKYECSIRRGKISVIELGKNLEPVRETDVLKLPQHLSYPYIFTHENKNYILPESHKTNELVLYQLLENFQLKKITTIFNNIDAVDSSIIFYENKFWLFFSCASKGDDKLYLAYADRLDGQWKMHQKNPVKSNIKSSRMAGQIFIDNGTIYRPSQNCEHKYGAAIVINKITQLTTENFSEIEEIEVMPNQLGSYLQGLHNISSLGENYTLIDGKKTVFVPYKALIYLVRFVQKIARKYN